MNLREQYNNETKLHSEVFSPSNENGVIKQEHFSIEYVEWLESKLNSLSTNDIKAGLANHDKKDWFNNDNYPETVGGLIEQLCEYKLTDLVIYEDKDDDGNQLDHYPFYIDGINISSDEHPDLFEVQICKYC